MLAVANAGSCVDPQNKLGNPPSQKIDAGSRVECLQNINRLQNMCYCALLRNRGLWNVLVSLGELNIFVVIMYSFFKWNILTDLCIL